MPKIKLLFFYISFLFSISSYSQWTQTAGPIGGATQEIFKVENSIVVATRWGGVYKSIDNGETWNPSNSGFPINPRIYDMFEADGTLYASLEYNGIYISTDKGDSWSSISPLQNEETSYYIFVDGNEIYGGLDRGGIIYSPDKGVTWQVKHNDGIANQFVNLHVHNSNLYAKRNNKLMVTQDDGDTWTEITVPGLSPNGVSSMTTHNDMLFIADENNVFFSVDDSTFTNTNLTAFGASITSLQSYADKLYATTNKGRYFYLSEIGQAWTLIQKPNTEGFVRNLLFLEEGILMSADDGIHRSDDEGLTWLAKNSGIKAYSSRSFAANSNYIFAAVLDGVYRTDTNGQDWQLVDKGFYRPSFQSYGVLNMLTVSETLFISTIGGIYSSINNGDSWLPKFLPSNNYTGYLDYDDGVLVTTESGTGVFLSDDLGETWTLAATEGLNTSSQFISILIKGDLIVVGNYASEIYLSTDLGQSWNEVSIPWNQYDNQRPIDLEYDNDKLYVTSTNGLWVSDDLGSQWQPFIENDTQYMDDVMIVNDTIYVTTSTGVKVSTEGRDSWYPLIEGMGPKRVAGLFVHNDVIFAGTYAHGIWAGPISELGVPPPDDDNDGIANVDDVCPNTNAGVLVNNAGCDLIAEDAIRIYGEDPTCPNEANGSIEITTSLVGYSFNISITGEGINESFEDVNLETDFKLENLAPGSYEVTVSIPAVHHEQMFGITINERNSISGKLQGVDTTSRSAKYLVSGSTSYTVDINGLQKTFIFSSFGKNEITLINLNVTNSITISGENDCQGKLEDSFSLDGEIQIYPTITSGLLSIFGGLEVTEIHIYDTSGQRVAIEKIRSGTDHTIHMDNYVSGLYIVHVKTEERTKIFKVIKK